MDTSTFAANALPLAALNLRIIPVEPYDKACKLLDWQNLATTDAAVIIGWDAIYPHHNLGKMCIRDSYLVGHCIYCR